MHEVFKSMERTLARMDSAIARLRGTVTQVRKSASRISMEIFTASVDHAEDVFKAHKPSSYLSTAHKMHQKKWG